MYLTLDVSFDEQNAFYDHFIESAGKEKNDEWTVIDIIKNHIEPTENGNTSWTNPI